MRRKSRVADTLKQLCADISLSSIQEGYEGVSAQQLSDFMGMDRANVSKELNQLFQENAVIKITGRPVYYFDRERMEVLLAHSLERFAVSSLQEYLQERGEVYTGIYNKDTQITQIAKGQNFVNDIDHFMPLNPRNCNTDNEYVDLVQANTILEWMEEHPEVNPDGKFSFIKGINEESNPVVILMK